MKYAFTLLLGLLACNSLASGDVRSMFDRLDQNRDGYISHSEASSEPNLWSRFGSYDRFVILEKDVERNVDYYGTGFGVGFGAFGRHSHSSIWYGGPGDYQSVASYRAVALIRVHIGGPTPGNSPIYDANEMIRQLGPRIVRPPVPNPS